MYIEQILPQKVADKRNFHQLTLTESKQNYTQPEQFNISDLALTIGLTSLSFVFLWVILRKIRSNLDKKINFSTDDLHQVPCKNCQFFANNYYLKCAVQPDIVLTKEAINCSEYCPKKSKFPGNKFFG